ncbi:hypothetical protein BZG36_02557 [Bifiguratus adelaidae]|uniref:Pleiotropic ABC efflux transporter N-terminal domain-containing protein n=1 Tax=Bifiguratus adelaidae TaxID=1938954 RepID=A0A261Y277_9FUNG|nr:hypothetical protein BZG36_02557 [Bifiguratus adelaidae]
MSEGSANILTRPFRTLLRRSTRKSHLGDLEKGDQPQEPQPFDLNDYLETGVRAADSNGHRRHHMGFVFKDLTIVSEGADASTIMTLLTPFVGIHKFRNPLRRGKANHRTVFDIVHNVTGFCEEGEMLLVLGRPGAGCSRLLRVLANSRKGFLDIKGDVTYSGIDAQDFKDYPGEAIYSME